MCARVQYVRVYACECVFEMGMSGRFIHTHTQVANTQSIDNL